MLRLISSLLIMLTMAGNAWCQQTDQPYHEAAGSERGYLHLGQSRAEQFSSVVSMDTIGGWNANPEAEALVYLLDAGWRKSTAPQLSGLGTNNGGFHFISGQHVAEVGDNPPLPTPDQRTILEAQEILAGLGYEPGPRDGVLSLRTRGAIRRFQSDSGLPDTGALDDATQAALIDAWADISRATDMGTTPSEGAAEPDLAARAAAEDAVGLDRQDRAFDPGPADGP